MSPASYLHKKTNGWPKVNQIFLHGKKVWQVDFRQSVKGRHLGSRKVFSDQSSALHFAGELREERQLTGIAVHGAIPGVMRESERIDALEALNILRPLNCSLMEAARLMKDHITGRRPYQKTPTVEKAWAQYFEQKISEATRGDLETTTVKGYQRIFDRTIASTRLATRRIDSIDSGDIQNWLNSIPTTPGDRKNCKATLSQLMNFARIKKWRTDNPCELIIVRTKQKEVETLAPKQISQLLAACRGHEQSTLLVPYFAVGCLAGLRPFEAEKLDWEDINLSSKQIKVWKNTSKNRVSRYVNLSPEALKMLTPYKRESGCITGDIKGSWRRYWEEARGQAGFTFEKRNIQGSPWPMDCLRHTFASYWLTRHSDKNELANQMGDSVAVINKHYRRAIPRSEAAAFWRIFNS